MTAQATNSRVFDKSFSFESYGVPVKIESNMPEILTEAESRIRRVMLDRIEAKEIVTAQLIFGLFLDHEGIYHLSKNGEDVTRGDSKENFFNYFESLLRISIGEFATSWVFLHAGVVGWKGKAIVIPATSYGGKSTLVAELVKRGAAYYSDDYAVFDKDGLVHPFPRMLSMRGIEDEHAQTDVSIESIGGTTGTEPIPVSCVLLTRYREDGLWHPKILTPGQAILEMVPHTLAVRRETEYALGVLKTVVNGAILVKSERGNAAEFTRTFLEFVDKLAI